MNPVHKHLSSIIKSQLPAFYQEYGPLFVDFVYSYYQWLEEEGQLSDISRNLPEYLSIDTAPNDFLDHFKAKYLAGIDSIDPDGIRALIKHARDLYDSKGSERSFQLLFQLLYRDKVSVSYPGIQVLRPSDGVWFKPKYLELDPNDTASDLVGKQVIGSRSKTTAFVEQYVRREINGRYYDVLYITNPQGTFRKGELITIEGERRNNAPRTKGSLTSLIVNTGGANNAVGDIFEISSTEGRSGLARVTAIENTTGRVNFELIDGGYGYTVNAEVAVSDYVLGASNLVSNAFVLFEVLEQNIANITFIGNTSNFSNGLFINGWNTGSPVGNGNVITASTVNATHGNIKVQVTAGSFATAADIGNVGNTANGVVTVVGNVMATANLIGWSSNGIGVYNPNNLFYALEGTTFVRGRTSNTYANTISKSTGSGADFNVGSITDTETLTLFTDLLRDTNSGGVLYMDMLLNGMNANIGFVEGVSVAKKLTYSGLFGYSEAFTNTESIDQVVISNSASTFTGTVSADANNLLVAGSGSLFSLFLEGEYLQIANSTAWDIIPITTIASNTEAYIKRPSRVTGSGLSYGKAVVLSSADNANANSTIITTYDSRNGIATGNSTANLIIGITSKALASVSAVTVLGGTGYDNATSVATFANGTPTVAANATAVVTNSTGGIVSITMNNNGNGYDQDANVSVSVGSGANLKVRMDYGYGFPKDPNAGYGDKIKNSLRSNSFTIGTIAAIANVNPGSAYNRNPFVVVIEPLIAGSNRQDFLICISNTVGTWIDGETVTQNVATGVSNLTYTGITANTAYEVGERVVQGNTAIPTAYGIVNAQNSTVLTLQNIVGSFVVTSNTLTQIRGQTSNALSNVASISTTSLYSTARGVILSSNSSHLVVDRTSYNTSFNTNSAIIGSSSGTTSNISMVQVDTSSEPLGFNADVTANVVTANGVATALEVIDSGFGFNEADLLLTLSNNNNPFVITAYSEPSGMGIGEGYFKSHRGWLNEAVIHDGDRYQNYSYIIHSSLSSDKYEDVVKNLVHVAGMKMFGDVERSVVANSTISIGQSSVSST